MVRRLSLLAIAFVLFVLSASAAQAATRGDFTIQIEGTFGQARGNLFPVTVQVATGGLVVTNTNATLSNLGVTTANGPVDVQFGGTPILIDIQVGGIPSRLFLLCVLDPLDARGHCVVAGGVVGVGTAAVAALEPQPGGRLVVEIDFPDAYCRLCRG